MRSVFDPLKAPALFDLTWKRNVHCNPPSKGKHRDRGEGSSEPKNIFASKRVEEFPEECLEVTGGKIDTIFRCIGVCVFIANELIWGKAISSPRLYRGFNYDAI